MEQRGSGILIHITSLPSPFGIGDLGPSAYCFADFLAACHQKYWQVLPLSPTTPLQGESPYSSISTFALNPLIASPEMLVEEGLLDHGDLDSRPDFPDTHVDYARVRSYKLTLLDRAYENFGHSAKREEFDGFVSVNSHWLEDYALFVATKERFGGLQWNQWQHEIKHRRPDALNSLRSDLGSEIDKQKFIQFVLFKQWHALKRYCNSRGIKIVGDLPIYVSLDSSDVWSSPEIFKLDPEGNPLFVAGVPPDYFSSTGQLWGNPVYDWQACRRSGFAWWLRRIGHLSSLYDVVRIDHFRGLVAYWEVAAGEPTAINGRWVEVPTYEFFDTVCSRYRNLSIIAEDLGVITQDVRDVMNHYGFPGMKVLLFAFGEDNPDHPYLPHTYEPNCVVYTGTHDNNTVRGWFEEETSVADRTRLARYLGHEVTADTVSQELIKLAMASVANTAIFPMQDVLGLGSDARMNTPSKADGNWRWRLRADQVTQEVTENLNHLTTTYGRA